jgi:hypothetical protein
MSTSKTASEDREARVKRVKAVLRSWDGPNSRVGFELNLEEMPWGPFDALGKHVSLLLPSATDSDEGEERTETEMERALRHVEHAADRCADFARLGNGGDDLWRTSQRTWEWLRDRLTDEWLSTEVRTVEVEEAQEEVEVAAPLPVMPGTAATLELVGRALRAIPLAQWREAVEELDPDGPTREEAVQTLLGVARLMESPQAGHHAEGPGVGTALEVSSAGAMDPSLAELELGTEEDSILDLEEGGVPEPGSDMDSDADHWEVTFEYARGFDQGYRIGRRVGRALGVRVRLATLEEHSSPPGEEVP